jgi:GntR family transcriptional regulator
MILQIQPASGTPIYLQIVNQLKYLVASGQLAPGDEIPPIRTLAEQLLVNPNTVARAYLELQRSGIVTKRHGAGTYVAERPPAVTRSQRQKVLNDRADALLADARQLGVELDEVMELLRARHEKMAPIES